MLYRSVKCPDSSQLLVHAMTIEFQSLYVTLYSLKDWAEHTLL